MARKKIVDVVKAYAKGRTDFTEGSLKFPEILEGVDLRGCNFSGQRLPFMDFEGANLEDCNFETCYLVGGFFSGANLTNVDFSHANLEDATFSGANLRWANFYRADLSDADLRGADLYGVVFSNANITGIRGPQFIGGVGNMRRTLFAYVFNGEVYYRVSYNNDPIDDLRRAVAFKYGGTGSEDVLADYMAALDYLEAWGNRQLKAASTGVESDLPFSTPMDDET